MADRIKFWAIAFATIFSFCQFASSEGHSNSRNKEYSHKGVSFLLPEKWSIKRDNENKNRRRISFHKKKGIIVVIMIFNNDKIEFFQRQICDNFSSHLAWYLTSDVDCAETKNNAKSEYNIDMNAYLLGFIPIKFHGKMHYLKHDFGKITQIITLHREKYKEESQAGVNLILRSYEYRQ